MAVSGRIMLRHRRHHPAEKSDSPQVDLSSKMKYNFSKKLRCLNLIKMPVALIVAKVKGSGKSQSSIVPLMPSQF